MSIVMHKAPSHCPICSADFDLQIELDVFQKTVRELKCVLKTLFDENGRFICACDSCRPWEYSKYKTKDEWECS